MAKKSVNLNAVLLVAALGNVQAFANKRLVEGGGEGGKDKSVLEFKLADGSPIEGDQVEEFMLTDSESVAQFNGLFDNLPVVKGGYYSYTNESGPTNPQIYKTFGPQGLAKIMAQAIQAAHLIIARGGEEAEQMKTLLAAVIGYSDLAAAKIAEQAADKLTDELSKLAISPEHRAALVAKLGGQPPVPSATVNQTEAEGNGEQSEQREHAHSGGRKRK